MIHSLRSEGLPDTGEQTCGANRDDDDVVSHNPGPRQFTEPRQTPGAGAILAILAFCDVDRQTVSLPSRPAIRRFGLLSARAEGAYLGTCGWIFLHVSGRCLAGSRSPGSGSPAARRARHCHRRSARRQPDSRIRSAKRTTCCRSFGDGFQPRS